MVKIPVMLEHSVSWLRPTVMFLLCCLYHCCRNRLCVCFDSYPGTWTWDFLLQRVMMMLSTIYMMFYDCRWTSALLMLNGQAIVEFLYTYIYIYICIFIYIYTFPKDFWGLSRPATMENHDKSPVLRRWTQWAPSGSHAPRTSFQQIPPWGDQRRVGSGTRMSTLRLKFA